MKYDFVTLNRIIYAFFIIVPQNCNTNVKPHSLIQNHEENPARISHFQFSIIGAMCQESNVGALTPNRP